jgi:hypothetical protein
LRASIDLNGLEESTSDHVGELKARSITMVVSVNLIEVDHRPI